MSASSVIIAVIITSAAVSYGWGMRGFIIGGEKGAVLPGALLGACMALFLGNGALTDYYYIFAAAGALTMFFGGTEPYAQTMSFILHREAPPYDGRPKKGAAGIFLKGALWHGICAAGLSMLPGALAGGIYKTADIIILFAGAPVIQAVGVKLFNSPYNKENKIFPKIYFSLTSREEWGGNLLLFAEMLIFILIRRDYFALGAAGTGFFCGGAGFLGGLLIYDFNVRGCKGRHVFGKYEEKGYIDNWKIMEHVFGAAGGGGIMLYFALHNDIFVSFAEAIKSGVIKTVPVLKDGTAARIIFILMLMTGLQYLITYIQEKNPAGTRKISVHVFELTERPLWAAFPLTLIFLGDMKMAEISAVLTVTYALCEKCIFEWYENFRRRNIIAAMFAVFFIAVTAVFIISDGIGIKGAMLIYTFGYTLPTVLYCFGDGKLKKCRDSGKSFTGYFKSSVSVNVNFLIISAVLTATVLQ